jgi:peptidoglycan-associated lipoprotein
LYQILLCFLYDGIYEVAAFLKTRSKASKFLKLILKYIGEFIMIKKIGIALFAVMLLSGCNGSKSKYNPHSKQIAEFETVIGDRVFYALNSANLSNDACNTLARQAEWLKKNKTINVTVAGHCDERGTREYNIALGEKRAEAVKQYFISAGISAERIETISYGKERPTVIGNDENAFSKNRRSVVAIR